ncbi:MULTISPECIES: hypothetical protein [unclassified Kitasatospora]|uniref:hypothetical protein n=1 Tax=unclassified Kitasatospora TaxID=2633591 RepID=UPI0033F82858
MTIDNDSAGEASGYELLAGGVWVDGEVVPAVIRIQRPAPLPSQPPLPNLGRCAGTRDCIGGECYCAEPMLSDFMFPDGDSPDIIDFPDGDSPAIYDGWSGLEEDW